MTETLEAEVPERTALYRIRGEADVLLYIGMTNSVSFRWNSHQVIQPWWDEVRSVTIEWYDSRPEAAAAEKSAILAEQPKYNVTYLKAGLWQRRQLEAAQRAPLPEAEFEPRDDDEDLLTIDDVAKIIRMTPTSAGCALRNTGGPRGFTLGATKLFRKGRIRRWIDSIEASQADAA